MSDKAKSNDLSDLQELLDAAIAKYKAMTPEERAAHDEAQRQSWVRANKRTGDPRFE